MNILILLREPIFDRIPSLKTLVWGLAEKGHNITLLTTRSLRFPIPSMSHPRLRIKLFAEREKKRELPTSFKLSLLAVKELTFHHYHIILGADCYANILASRLSTVFRLPHVCFQLEYPNFPPQSLAEKQEIKSIETARILITHDRWHHDFLKSQMDLTNTQVCYLPNATYSQSGIQESHMLQDRVGEYQRKIILHSGGFGRWFRCRELAQSSKQWNSDYLLVFHLSHQMEGDPYFDEVYQNKHSNMAFSQEPVGTDELDKLVSSAHVGVALYSEKDLGYRATYMGVAAGKIGNYLKCGLPVIATRLPSLQYLEDFYCGILIDHESEIQTALQCIDKNYLEYRQNALHCYRELWDPEAYICTIEESLLKLS